MEAQRPVFRDEASSPFQARFIKLIFDSSIDILKSRSHIINSLRLKKPNFAAIVVPK